MLSFIISRLLSAVFVIFGVSCLVFFLIHLVPGDPVEVMLGESSQPADREALRAALGLDQPILVQLVNYFMQTTLLFYQHHQKVSKTVLTNFIHTAVHGNLKYTKLNPK